MFESFRSQQPGSGSSPSYDSRDARAVPEGPRAWRAGDGVTVRRSAFVPVTARDTISSPGLPAGSGIRHSIPCKFRALTIMAALPHCDASYPLPVRQGSALPSASSRFAVARSTLAVRLTLPLAGRVEDFHLQVSAPCRAHHKKSGGPKTSALTCRLLLFDQAIEKMPRPAFAPIPTSVFCTLV